jgi:hypothetical protein
LKSMYSFLALVLFLAPSVILSTITKYIFFKSDFIQTYILLSITKYIIVNIFENTKQHYLSFVTFYREQRKLCLII